MIATRADLAVVWACLGEIADPEIPAISIVDLGIVRDVAWVEDGGGAVLRVTVTPTYSGCPATRVIQRDIVRALNERGIQNVELAERLAPPWTTDWLTRAGRDKLHAYGISLPGSRTTEILHDITALAEPHVVCPRCESVHVELTSWFGSTPCKALYRCNACREPFDHFKCH